MFEADDNLFYFSRSTSNLILLLLLHVLLLLLLLLLLIHIKHIIYKCIGKYSNVLININFINRSKCIENILANDNAMIHFTVQKHSITSFSLLQHSWFWASTAPQLAPFLRFPLQVHL